MSNNQSDDESAIDSQQESEQQPADSNQLSAQSDEQAAQQSDEFAQQSEEQLGDSDQLATSAGDTDAVASAGGDRSKRNIRVIATFTQEQGKKFNGDIQIQIFEWDNGQKGQFLFPTGSQGVFQPTGSQGNVIDTGMLPDIPDAKIVISARARVLVDVGPSGEVLQNIDQTFVIPLPSGDTLRVIFDVHAEDTDRTFDAPNALAATNLFRESVGKRLVLPPGPVATGCSKAAVSRDWQVF